jgi:tetratricopeptide (TPR) repeat protein
VLNTQPGDAKALSGFTTLYLRQNQPEAAIGILQDTLKKAPQLNATQPNTVDVATVQIMLGEVYAGLKRQPEAIAAYDAAIAADPKDARPVWGKARVLKAQANLEGAKELYNKAFALAKPEYKDAIKGELNQLTAATPAPITPSQGQGSAAPATTPAAKNPASSLPSLTPSPAAPAADSNTPPANPGSSKKP